MQVPAVAQTGGVGAPWKAVGIPEIQRVLWNTGDRQRVAPREEGQRAGARRTATRRSPTSCGGSARDAHARGREKQTAWGSRAVQGPGALKLCACVCEASASNVVRELGRDGNLGMRRSRGRRRAKPPNASVLVGGAPTWTGSHTGRSPKAARTCGWAAQSACRH